MNSMPTVPDEGKLRQLLDGTLSDTEQAEVLAMVEQHPQWQAVLDRLAAGAQTWEAAAQHLHQPPLTADAALRSAIAGITPPTATGDMPPQPEESLNLSFLTPVEDSRYLGSFGQYLVEQVVGRGGFGIVLKAFDPQLRRIVALKVLAPHLANNATACVRFNREAHAAAAVVHDHVITIHSVGDQPLPHLVMQYVAGQSLQEKLDKTGPLGIKEVLRIGMQTAAGLAAAHKHGEVHRDIKPANILLENGVERVKITDFGLARAADDASMTQSGTVAGTPQYMSPEQARGETVDFRSDLFSLGSVLYAMCAGRPPFRATTTMGVLKRVCEDPPRPVREINPDIPQWLADIIDRLMAKNPGDRFASAGEVSDLLGQCLSHVQQPGAAPLPAWAAGTPHAPSAAPAEIPAPPGGAPGAAGSDDALVDYARRSVREPAIGLIVTGILNCLALAVAIFFLSSFLTHGRLPAAWWLIPVVAFVGLCSGLIVLGGLKMLRLENRSLVTFAAITALLISPGCLVGFAMGLWALVVLSRREVQRGFAAVARRHWPGVADAPAELPEEGEWSGRCLTCNCVAPLHKWGGVRIGAASRGKRSILWCPVCRWFRWMAIEQFSAKAQPPMRVPVVYDDLPQTERQSGGVALVLLAVFLVFAIPLTLIVAAGTGYFFMTKDARSVSDYAGGNPSEPMGGLLYQNSDSRFEVRVVRTKSPSGDHLGSMDYGPNLRHGRLLRVPAGEYRAEVKSDGIVVREDTLNISAEGPPTTYKIAAAGTLRFVAEPGDKNLAMAINHIAGQTIWNWPDRQTILLPEGLVHVDLRRPDGNGAFQILTNNYFDIVAGQETVLRVRQNDVELVTSDDDLDPVMKLHRENLKTVEGRHAAGQSTLLECIEAKIKYFEAAAQRAEQLERLAALLAARRQIVALAQERAEVQEALYKLGRQTQVGINDAKLDVLKARERLAEAEAKVQAADQSAPKPAQVPREQP